VTSLVEDFRAAADPVALSLQAGIRPDPWQERILRSNSQRLLLNCSRQSGKSLMAAMLCAHTAIFKPGSLTLLVSPSERQSSELFKRVHGIFRSVSWPVPVASESALRLELANGSRVVSLPGKEGTVRGFSAPKLIVIDESARVPDELYVALKPMLAVSQGRVIACSTPWGTRGWWHDAWRSAEPWERYRVPATDCPRISAELLAEERRSLGHWEFAQEYLTEFQAGAGAVFDLEAIENCFDSTVQPLGLLNSKVWTA